MKKQMITLGIAIITCFAATAQTTSTFENLTLQPDTSWNGSDLSGGFTSGNAYFTNKYDTSYGGFWASGWAYSDMTDSTTSGFGNLYSAKTAIGYNNSANYAVGQQDAVIKLTGNALGKVVSGLYITNSTYAYNSMHDGDQFAKKFTNADSDWFKVTIKPYLNGQLQNDSVVFFLANFTHQDSSQDYIVNTWQWVDLAALGNVDSLQFHLSSSDTGTYGMNTPAFFCIDNFTTADHGLGIAQFNQSNISVYPSPASDFINISNLKSGSKIAVYNIVGKEILTQKTLNQNHLRINISDLKSGIYFVKIANGNAIESYKVIKN